MRLRSILASVVLLSASLVARADNTTTFYLNSSFDLYDFATGTGTPAGTITGTLTLDTTLGYFTGADLTASGFSNSAADTTLTSVTLSGGDYFGHVGTTVTDGAGDTLYLYLAPSTLAGYTGSSICSLSSSPACYIDDLSGYTNPAPTGGFEYDAEAGTIEPETVAATPEPSSFLLLATGLLGAAGLSRRRLA